ncbi:Histone H4 type VIII [Eumeta japonica]|uniref:Histone H4 n=1 Tax=Eumeta variegata TaxID=151549 RepID=A0A4C2A0E3_EUMVA|nr:Histone H4 type VIII [Eumeta japonica]
MNRIVWRWCSTTALSPLPAQTFGHHQPAIRRLARRGGGVKRISGLIYEETRGVLKVFLENVTDAVTYTEHAKEEDRHRYGRRLRAETSGAHPLRVRRLNGPARDESTNLRVYEFSSRLASLADQMEKALSATKHSLIYNDCFFTTLSLLPRTVRIVKSREGQVKSCNNVDEKRSVGREALITVYPTVREVVDSGASRFAYLAFVRICIRRVPRIRSTGADDPPPRRRNRRLPRSVRRSRSRRRNRRIRRLPRWSTTRSGSKERSGSSLQAIKIYRRPIQGRRREACAFIRKYLKSAVESGTLIQTKGKGASGSFKLESKSSSGSKKSSGGGGGGGGSGGVAVGAKGRNEPALSLRPPPLRREPAAAARRAPPPRSSLPEPRRARGMPPRPVLRRRNLKRRPQREEGRRRRRGRSGCRLRPPRRRSPPPPPRRRRRRASGGVAPKAKKTAKPPTKTESSEAEEGRDAEGETRRREEGRRKEVI